MAALRSTLDLHPLALYDLLTPILCLSRTDVHDKVYAAQLGHVKSGAPPCCAPTKLGVVDEIITLPREQRVSLLAQNKHDLSRSSSGSVDVPLTVSRARLHVDREGSAGRLRQLPPHAP
eukprot:CAMPEP_0183366294 /NCGR_PEP_ID=MMETSP0164_2-20130417/88090_1 /TAXON_ID=221442 /ORGANISM="Coccolithus pelagicus ssp braarudi, Strain PLY182g" /LENGTH=118 /DNA_ID=CAMNT_0025541997 /DNA_START=199 /DNA_END=555 /DNA_ORIENTATION=+